MLRVLNSSMHFGTQVGTMGNSNVPSARGRENDSFWSTENPIHKFLRSC